MNLKQTLQAHGMLFTELPNFLLKARPEDIDLIAEIVKGFADAPPDTDDEAIETIFTPLLSRDRTFNGAVDLWRIQSLYLLLYFVREATHEATQLLIGLARDLKPDQEPSPADWHRKPAFTVALFTHLAKTIEPKHGVEPLKELPRQDLVNAALVAAKVAPCAVLEELNKILYDKAIAPYVPDEDEPPKVAGGAS